MPSQIRKMNSFAGTDCPAPCTELFDPGSKKGRVKMKRRAVYRKVCVVNMKKNAYSLPNLPRRAPRTLLMHTNNKCTMLVH